MGLDAPPVPADFLKARLKLMPIVRDPLSLVSSPERRYASRPLADDYCLALACDAELYLAPIEEAHLENWKVPFERALEYALDNLRRIPPTFSEIRSGLFRSAEQDSHDAARMLLPAMLSSLSLRGRPVVTVPRWSTLFVTGEEDREGLVELSRLTDQELQKERGIGGVPLILEGDSWKTFHPLGPSEAAVKVRNLVAKARGWRYFTQKKLLERQESAERPVLVASYSLMRKDGEEEMITFCTWARGVRALLPQALEVGFFDPSSNAREKTMGMYPWERVIESAGRYMKPAGLLPERWLVEEFPDAETFDRLAPYRTR
jgi:hypothetical protein